MLKRSITIVVAGVLLCQVCGCTTLRMIPLQEVVGEYKGSVVVWTTDGKEVRSDPGISYVQSDSLYTMIEGQAEVIPITNIRVFLVKKSNPVGTIVITVAGAISLGIIYVAVIW